MLGFTVINMLPLEILKDRIRERLCKNTSVIGYFVRMFEDLVPFAGAFTVVTGLT